MRIVTGRLAVIWFLGFLIAAIASPVNAADLPAPAAQGSVWYANIAPGEFEKESEWSSNFNVRVEFASETGAPYAGVYVRVFNPSGILVFKRLCEKPWLFLKLEPGTHHVIAIDRKKNTEAKEFQVKVEKLSTVKLAWPQSVVGY